MRPPLHALSGGVRDSCHCQARAIRRVSAPKFGAATGGIPSAPKDPINGLHSPACPLRARRARRCRAPVGAGRNRTRPGYRSVDRPRQRRRDPPERNCLAEEEIGSNIPNMPPEQRRDYLITYLADMVLLSQAADQQKLGRPPDVKRRLAFDHNRLLMEALLQGVGKDAVSDEAEHKVYDDAVKQMTDEQEVRARHILVADRGGSQGDARRAEEGRGFRRRSPRRSPRIRARPKAAISAISPRSRWCRNSPRSPSSSTRARSPIR